MPKPFENLTRVPSPPPYDVSPQSPPHGTANGHVWITVVSVEKEKQNKLYIC